ncbi:MAG: hypothetical protein JWO67_4495 [Streptosporangiaceae bacterium]|nr:hypothetical protein [Streptosporangiaceae bacterium]
MTTMILSEQQMTILRFLRSELEFDGFRVWFDWAEAQFDGYPLFVGIAERVGISAPLVVRDEMQELINAGLLYRTCCGDNPGVHVRLPGEEDSRGHDHH